MSYTTIITEGGLLPADVLAAIANEELSGQRAEDFGLERGRNLSDRIAAAWQAARGQWLLFTTYREDLRPNDPGTSLTRQRLMLPLLDVLGYQLHFNQAAYLVAGRSYAISHRAGSHEHAPPVHIEGVRTSLDARPPSGRPRLSPHALLQEYLNTTEQLWGIVTNGERLRLLRDSSRFTRPAYVEFDLRAMFEGEQFSEFALFYRLLHRSRLPQSDADASNALLEHYHQQARERGGRVRDKLRDGVETALKTLGNGLLTHPANHALRAKFGAGQLTELAFYRQLLRLVYRLLFLMVAEERGLIATGTRRLTNIDQDPFEVSSTQSFDALLATLVAGPSSADRLKIYYEHYSIARLRRLAEQPGVGRGPYDDLWQGLQQTFRLLEGSDEQNPRSLGLAPLDGDLFGADALNDLDGQQLRNAHLLAALRALSLYQEKESKTLRRVNYGALDVEELGSVYESLLDYRPVIALQPATTGAEQFQLVSGTERKTTGSYYTRPELVQELIGSALAPVIAARLADARAQPAQAPDARRQAAEAALLAIRVVDPACGSGHFLLAAARRLGRELARLRSGEEQPTPAQFRRAVRDVIQHCIYGVDHNPLAVDLCKLALWLEGHNAGMPLSFLDSHIKQGNSLIGTTYALVAAGIPDDAYKPLTGDDRQVASQIKKRNKPEREAYLRGYGQATLFDAPTRAGTTTLANALRQIDELAASTVADVRTKAARYRQARAAAEDEFTRFNLWTAAFFQPLTPANAAQVVTSGVLAEYERNPRAIRADIIGAANALAAEASFFHWELEFPQVFDQAANGSADRHAGFDVVLGNPPWEMLNLMEREHFVDEQEILNAATGAARAKVIEQWRTGTPKQRARIALFDKAKYQAEAESRYIHGTKRFPLTAVGRLNTYALFAEHARNLLAATGRAGLIVPTGIATDDTTKDFFGSLSQQGQLVSLYDFENREAIFPAVDSRMKFCTLTIGATRQPTQFIFFATNTSQLKDEQRSFSLSAAEIALINPNTRTAPVFRTRADAELTKKIYRRMPVLLDEHTRQNPWGVSFRQGLFNMTSDSHLFHDAPGAGLLPLYEAKLLHQFTHRWASYAGSETHELALAALAKPTTSITPRYWVEHAAVEARLAERGWQHGWLLGFRDIARATDERTAIFSLLPRVGVGHTAPLIFLQNANLVVQLCFLACVNSLSFDYIVRQKMGGTHLTYTVINQLPVLPPTAFSAADIGYIVPRVLELVYTAWDMQPFAEDVWREAGGDAADGEWDAPAAAAGASGAGGDGAALCAEILRRNTECNASADPALFAACGGFVLPPFCWNDQRRAQIRAELDARIAQRYGLSYDELRYILDPHDVYGPDFPGETFRVLKEKELKQFGEYRTRRLILAAMQNSE